MVDRVSRRLPYIIFGVGVLCSLFLFYKVMSLENTVPAVPVGVPVPPSNAQRFPPICFHVYGFNECPWFQRARCVAKEFKEANPNIDIRIEGEGVPRAQWQTKLKSQKEIVTSTEAQAHRTSPFVYQGCNSENAFIGGHDSFVAMLNEQFAFESKKCG